MWKSVSQLLWYYQSQQLPVAGSYCTGQCGRGTFPRSQKVLSDSPWLDNDEFDYPDHFYSSGSSHQRSAPKTLGSGTDWLQRPVGFTCIAWVQPLSQLNKRRTLTPVSLYFFSLCFSKPVPAVTAGKPQPFQTQGRRSHLLFISGTAWK